LEEAFLLISISKVINALTVEYNMILCLARVERRDRAVDAELRLLVCVRRLIDGNLRWLNCDALSFLN